MCTTKAVFAAAIATILGAPAAAEHIAVRVTAAVDVPTHRIKGYRGGMQAREILGPTTVPGG